MSREILGMPVGKSPVGHMITSYLEKDLYEQPYGFSPKHRVAQESGQNHI
jgi:hypothetical protein